jgi:hypothetical protein
MNLFLGAESLIMKILLKFCSKLLYSSGVKQTYQFPSSQDVLFYQKNISKCHPQVQIEDSTGGEMRLLTCSFYEAEKYGTFYQQLSVVAHNAVDAYAS